MLYIAQTLFIFLLMKPELNNVSSELINYSFLQVNEKDSFRMTQVDGRAYRKADGRIYSKN